MNAKYQSVCKTDIDLILYTLYDTHYTFIKIFSRFPKPKYTPTVTQYTPVITYNPVPPYRPLTPPLTPRPLTPVVTVSPTGSAPLLATLAADPDRFSTLVAAVTAANITQDTVDTIAPATIFAPTNAAFAKVKQYTEYT